MKRYLATLYRGRWLYLLVLLVPLVASIVGAFYLARPSYEASARVWIGAPVLANLLNQTPQPTYPVPPTLAKEHVDRFQQLLQSDAFMAGIVRKTAAASELTGDPRSDAMALDDIRQRLAISAAGTNTMTVAFTAPDRELCQQMVQVALAEFRAWSIQEQVEQRTAEAQEYQRQLRAQEAQITEFRRAIADAQRQFPAIPDGATPQYLELERLNRELEAAQGRHMVVRGKLDQAGLSENPDDERWLSQFRIQDAPTALPQGTFATLLGRLTYLALGLGTGAALVAVAVSFTTWRDTTVRNVDELAALTDVPILGVVPHLLTRSQRRDRSVIVPPRRTGDRSLEISPRGVAE